MATQKFIYGWTRSQIPLCPPFLKGGILLITVLTPLWKRGEGEIFEQKRSESCGAFLEKYTGDDSS
jgi:hypothetical protein